MLYFEINGRGHRRTCKDVLRWFIGEYLPRHHLDITVAHRGMKREGNFGLCTSWSDYRPREFLIEIHSGLDKPTYITTLLHELWHVYQHVKGDLQDKRSHRLWKGIDHSNTDYDDQPWEVEAHRMEKVLYEQMTGKRLPAPALP